MVWHLISTIYPPFLVSVIRPFFNWADSLVFITNKTIDYYLGDSPNKQKKCVIYEPVDINYFDSREISKEKKKIIKKELKISEDYKIIGFVGNISPQKGLEYFIKVVHKVVNKTNTKVKFIIVGGASVGHNKYYASLKNQITELNLDKDIVFLGNMSRAQIRNILSVMDIFLMTSIAEGTPLVIFEAMSMGIPVVATDVGGISEQVVNGETGLVLFSKDVNAIAKAVVYLLKNENVREHFGINARERAEEFFSLNKCIEEHLLLYVGNQRLAKE